MYCLPAFALASWSLLASTTIAKPITDLTPLAPARRDVQLVTPHSKRSMVKRDANTTFDLGFEAKDITLFDGDWQALGQTFSLSLACVECRTWGTLEASAAFPEDLEDLIGDLSDLNPLNDASVSVGFRGVGALVDLSLTTGGNGQFELPLFVTETPLGIAGPGFQIGIVFGVDLVLGITGKVETEGGFQVAIPDGSSFTIPLDPTAANIAKFDGASASLLPLTASAPANVTAALRLRVQAGIELPSSPLLEAKALAGAYINIPEVILGEQFALPPPNGSTCILPANAEININAGVFIDVGADVGDLQIADFNPKLSTTLFSAAASTCFLTAGQATSTAPAIGTGTGIGGASRTIPCPVALTTETKTTMTSFAITSCAAPVPNCPASLTQVIVLSQPATVTSSGCPVSVNATTSTAPFANATAPAAGNGGAGAGAISLTSLTAPVTNTLTIDPSISTPDVPSITASARTTETASAGNGEAAAEDGVTTYYVTVAPTSCDCSESAVPSA
ncbi:uncharacterized protein F4822DRAFT_142880 [Hypoxylon trugodes]|uniref:uncharacterized protein n=1 Tax=Hypoxylon trugodes TaxID=326681 RepID=UPI002192B203|nr:uncharacterized protein F4822DRAFT_142880 [Hypoxylon trugodes]KAI1392839.1 hypothetical protein F4822DRAFT_142880 [Hypoxylon trugodes]